MFCNGLRHLTEAGMLLHSLHNWCEVKLPEWVYMPVIGCIYCYASFWGTIIYWLLTMYGFSDPISIEAIIMWPIVCVSCVFTNGLFYGIISKYSNFIPQG